MQSMGMELVDEGGSRKSGGIEMKLLLVREMKGLISTVRRVYS